MKSIKWRLVLIYGVLILALTVILGIISVVIVENRFTSLYSDNIRSVAKREAKYISSLKDKEIYYIETLARNGYVTGNNFSEQEKVDFLNSEINTAGYKNFYIVDLNGKTEISTGNKKVFKNYEFFNEALKGNSDSSDIFVENNEINIYFYAPVKSDGKTEKIFIGEKDAIYFSDISSHITYRKTGTGYIINNEGRVVAHPNTDLVKTESNHLKESSTDDLSVLMREKMLKGTDGYGSYTYNNIKKVAGFSPVEGTSWVVVVVMERNEITSEVGNLIKILILVIVIIVIVGTVITLKVSYGIAEPFTELSKVIEKIANYDLRFAADSKAAGYLKRKDEIGKMTKSVKKVEESLTELIKKTKESSEKLVSTSEQISQTSAQSAISSEEVAKAVSEIANSSSEQAQNTETGSMDMKGMEKLLDKNQIYISELNKNARNINALKDEGIKTVKELTQKNKENLKSTDEIKEIIFSTNESADQIQTAVKKLKEIVKQTNLLAVNAAIEAAGAGEAGKGFAVVADQLRKLADDSNKFTDEINSIMEILTGKTRNAVKTMEEMNTIAEEQSGKVTETEERFEGISSSIDNINSTIKLLTESGEVIEEKKNKVVGILESLSSIAEENASGTQEVAASVEEQSALVEEVSGIAAEVKKMADQLGELISKFIL